MNLYSMGDCYVWYCDWCDSTNQVHCSRVLRNAVTCCVCHHPKGESDVEEFGLLRRAA